MPIYNDGLFEVFEIIEDDSVQANTSLQSKDISMTYQELGISDRLRSDLDSHDIDIQLKIRVPYVKGFIDSMSVLKIDEHYYKVYNIYHFVDNNCPFVFVSAVVCFCSSLAFGFMYIVHSALTHPVIF